MSARVDDDDFVWLSQWKWQAMLSDGKWYAKRGTQKNYIKKTLLMHRVILGAPDGLFVDHKDHDGLNNQKHNIRTCTPRQNSVHMRPKPHGSQFKGVTWHKRNARWQAQIRADGKRIYLGQFDSGVMAAQAYDAAAKKYHGEFALTNFA
jgi:hypothetical protein